MRVHTSFVSIALLSAVTVVAGCANRPESIAASYISHERYTDLDCQQLVTKITDTRAELDKVSKMQDSKANGDAWGVFLLGVPFSKLSGDHEGDVARLKGEVQAIETAQIKNKCKPA
jgi:hypothetical protein